MSSSQTKHSFELVLFSELVNQFTNSDWIELAQIYKLRNQNSLSDAWQSL